VIGVVREFRADGCFFALGGSSARHGCRVARSGVWPFWRLGYRFADRLKLVPSPRGLNREIFNLCSLQRSPRPRRPPRPSKNCCRHQQVRAVWARVREEAPYSWAGGRFANRERDAGRLPAGTPASSKPR
jgi:hypothetical protein